MFSFVENQKIDWYSNSGVTVASTDVNATANSALPATGSAPASSEKYATTSMPFNTT